MPPFDPERFARIRARIVAAAAVAGTSASVAACDRPLAPNTPDPNTVHTINEPERPTSTLPVNPPAPSTTLPPTPTGAPTAQPTGSASAPPMIRVEPTRTMNPPPNPRPLTPPENG